MGPGPDLDRTWTRPQVQVQYRSRSRSRNLWTWTRGPGPGSAKSARTGPGPDLGQSKSYTILSHLFLSSYLISSYLLISSYHVHLIHSHHCRLHPFVPLHNPSPFDSDFRRSHLRPLHRAKDLIVDLDELHKELKSAIVEAQLRYQGPADAKRAPDLYFIIGEQAFMKAKFF